MPSATSGTFRLPAWVAAAALALIAGLVLATHVYRQFEPVRFKALREPLVSQNGEVTVVLPPAGAVAELRAPMVLIATVRNTGTAPAAITLRVGGTAIETLKVAAGEKRRVDLTLPSSVAVAPETIVSLRGQASAWTLDYLELANVHGSSTAILRFFIVPATFDDGDAPPLWLTGFAVIAIFLLAHAGQRAAMRGEPARWPTKTHRVVSIVFLVFFAVTLLSNLVSPYKILLAPESFVLCVLVLAGRGVWQLLQRGRTLTASTFSVRPSAFDIVIIALIVAGFYTSAMFALREPWKGNYSALLRIGKNFADRNPFLQERPELKSTLVIHEGAGYDAEFAFFMAFDPFLTAFKANPVRYRDVVDAPPYRYGRIGFSLLTKLFSGDRPERYPMTMVWLVIAGHFIGALCLAGIFAHYGRAAAWGLLYLLVPGFLQSLHVTLPESIAGAMLLGGYLAWLRSRIGVAAVLFAIAMLVRETSAILVVSLIVWEIAARKRPRAAVTLASAVAVLAAWRMYVCWRLFADWQWQGLFFDPENMGVPFKGFADLWSMIARGQYAPQTPHLATSGMYYPLLLTAALAFAIVLLLRARQRIAPALPAALVIYGLVAVSLNYSSIWEHVGNGERGTYELLLFLIVCFASLGSAPANARLRTVFAGFFGALALYLIAGAVDAVLVRQVLMLPSF